MKTAKKLTYEVLGQRYEGACTSFLNGNLKSSAEFFKLKCQF